MRPPEPSTHAPSQANWRQTALHLLRQRMLAAADPAKQHQKQKQLQQQGPEDEPTKDYTPDEHAIQAAAKPIPTVPGLQSMFLYKRWIRRYMQVRGGGSPGSSERRIRADLTGSERALGAAAAGTRCRRALGR